MDVLAAELGCLTSPQQEMANTLMKSKSKKFKEQLVVQINNA